MEKLIQLGEDIAKLWGKYASHYISGMGSTIVIALLCTLVGCLIGLLCGILQTIPYAKNDHPLKRGFLCLVRAIVRIYVELFRGTPMILQAVVIYYALPYFSDNAVKFTSIWLAAFVVVSINTGAYMAESVRGGIISIDPGQTEGAKAIEVLASSLPLSVRDKAERAALRVIAKIRRDASIKASHRQNDDGTYTVQLKICDKQSDQLSVEVLAMTRRQCELLEDNFRRRAESLYHELLLLLSGGGTVE